MCWLARREWTASLKAVPAFADPQNLTSEVAPVHPARLLGEMRRDLAGHDPLYPAILELVRRFLALEPIPQELQDRLVAALGLPAFMQLSVVIVYYRMIAGLAKGFEFPLPTGMSDPF